MIYKFSRHDDKATRTYPNEKRIAGNQQSVFPKVRFIPKRSYSLSILARLVIKS